MALVLLAAAALLVAAAAAAFNESDVRYVDQSPAWAAWAGRFLFRGPYAGGADGGWDHGALEAGVRAAAARAGATLPAAFTVVDVSLLTVEWDDLEAEARAYEDAPAFGRFSHWPQFGTNLNASALQPDVRAYVAAEAPQPYGDYLEMLVDTLHWWLLGKGYPPLG
eukprot:TRINITY_DN1310_c0_g1_i2.p1 TRINITY_DN1310_c0_g1~~TRINITY_DN1310_c0_g1_i2.p1  ORF type:complete len:166 (+),score=54.85 TRINITY_DN1310_c0_g1_i2:2-499(+)